MGIQIGVEIIFLIKALFFGFAAIVLIPKEQYKKFLVYGLFLGALGDILLILIVSVLFGAFHYLNLGVFNILNITSFWTPIAWMFTVMFFLYALPTKKLYFYIYVLCFGAFGYFLGLVLQNLKLFEYVGIYRYAAPLVLSSWFYLVARLYMMGERIKLQ